MNKSLIIIIVSIIALGWFSLSRINRLPSSANVTESTGTQTVSQGQFSIDKQEIDLGQMKVTDEKTADFTLTNSGSSTLTVSQFETSCDCTFARVVIASTTSPEFNMRMHVAPDVFAWKADIAPGEQAKIQMIYKPSIMPVYGKVVRELHFRTSDPERSEVALKIIATVQ